MLLAHAVTLFPIFFFLLFYNVPPPTEIYTLSLHDALPIFPAHRTAQAGRDAVVVVLADGLGAVPRRRLRPLLRLCAVQDRKSTRLNSSHSQISYAVFCLKKKKK